MQIQTEICCGSYADALAAMRGNASRIELNSALPLGGLTPDIGDLLLCKERLSIPVIAMLRPRAGGFCYTENEFLSMQKSAETMLAAGADGLAFGILTPERMVDVSRTRLLVELIHSYGRTAVFHRAFDCLSDFAEGMERLIELGADRVLTSGGAATAPEGMEMIAYLQGKYGGQIELLAGCGVRSANVEVLICGTGISQVHSSCQGMQEDYTAHGENVSFALKEGADWAEYPCVGEETVREFCMTIAKLETNR